MTEATLTAHRLSADPTLILKRRCRAGLHGYVLGVVVVVFLFMAFGLRSSVAHETIDTQRANALLAAADEALARAEAAAAFGPKGEARFALGLMLAEAADVLNRDLAAHGGRLAFNAEHLLKALAQRDLAPRFDEVIGRYRTPRAAFEEALRLSPHAPYALRARFELLKAAFYESFDINPLALVGIGFDELERQIAESKAVASAFTSPEEAAEAAFIHAVDLARAAKLAPGEAIRAQYRRRADAALKSFAEHYPGSLRAATADTLRQMIAEDGG